MSTASTSRRGIGPFHWLSGLARPWLSPLNAVGEPPTDSDSPQAHAARTALMQAESPAERIHAIHQAQVAGVPLHEIEQQLDWADARVAAGAR